MESVLRWGIENSVPGAKGGQTRLVSSPLGFYIYINQTYIYGIIHIKNKKK